MADKKKGPNCAHYPRWPLGVGVAAAIVIIHGVVKFANTHSFDKPETSQPIPVIAGLWSEIRLNPQRESGTLDVQDAPGLMFRVARNRDYAHAVPFSTLGSPADLGNGNTNLNILLEPGQGVESVTVKFVRKLK